MNILFLLSPPNTLVLSRLQKKKEIAAPFPSFPLSPLRTQFLIQGQVEEKEEEEKELEEEEEGEGKPWCVATMHSVELRQFPN